MTGLQSCPQAALKARIVTSPPMNARPCPTPTSEPWLSHAAWSSGAFDGVGVGELEVDWLVGAAG